MWSYEKRLQYPVNITTTNPKLAMVIMTQLGGPDGEKGAATRYISQRLMLHFCVIGIMKKINQVQKIIQFHQEKKFGGNVIYVDTNGKL